LSISLQFLLFCLVSPNVVSCSVTPAANSCSVSPDVKSCSVSTPVKFLLLFSWCRFPSVSPDVNPVHFLLQ
jgi:hypothetical protein